ncbi:MAG TPA: class I SAM-dependent methyltransferase [Puia sp.]|jgi:SAM-dependent methyltransferase|nr:class I SAM-dependent methyltransferase [Puia sp.]
MLMRNTHIAIKRFIRGRNSKFIYLKRSFGNNSFKLLDVGVGNHSASKTVTLFPACEYYGVDLNKEYNNNDEDFKVMKCFYEMDLTKLDFHLIPDEYFDGIWIVHVIEHLHNGDKVIENLIGKLKAGGFMYIEYPGIKSTKLPSMYGTLNFYDDHSHVRIYSVKELTELFEKNGCKVLRGGIRRNLYFILVSPLRILGQWVRAKKLIGNIFWDILGFAEFIYVRKL